MPALEGRLPKADPTRNARAIRPAIPSFFLDPSLYPAFPKRRRAQLVALFNLIIAFGRPTPGAPPRLVVATQGELAGLLGLSGRQVRNLEADLEELGAIRCRYGLPGLRGGRALELVPLEDWLPDGLWARRPTPAPEAPAELSTTRRAIVENPLGAEHCSSHGGIPFRPRADSLSTTARARQSNSSNEVTRTPAPPGGLDEATPPARVARELFGFLRRTAGLSGRTWKESLVALEDLVRERGPNAALAEVERIARAARQAVNPGGYAYACLFPDGSPNPRGAALRAMGGGDAADPGPLYRGLTGNSGAQPVRAPAPCAQTHGSDSQDGSGPRAP